MGRKKTGKYLLSSKSVCVYCRTGWVEQGEVTLIPEFSAVRLSVATGMLGAADQEWTDFVSMFALAVRHVHYYHIDHCPGTPHTHTDCLKC